MTSTFEDRLLTELQREAHLATAENPAPAPRARRTRLRIATGLAATAAIAGSTLAFPGGTTSPAYAVEQDDEGRVTLVMTEEMTVDRAEQQAFATEMTEVGIEVVFPTGREVCGLGGSPSEMERLERTGENPYYDVIFGIATWVPTTDESGMAASPPYPYYQESPEGNPFPLEAGDPFTIDLGPDDSIAIMNNEDMDSVDYLFFHDRGPQCVIVPADGIWE
ncbi:hypothetical protein [Streptomyces sp. NPDC049879]|uniref:hypothetical protein n=1 Tax=Streptomyces sp. NPDC049879 TaxID=3365598 RepID=UPI003794FFB8